MQRDAIHRRRHAMLTHTIMDIGAGIIIPVKNTVITDPGIV